MSGILAAIVAYATGGIGGKIALWLAGKFGGRLIDGIGERFERRRKAEGKGDGKQA